MYSRVDFGFDYNFEAFDSGFYSSEANYDLGPRLIGSKNDIGMSHRVHSIDKSTYGLFVIEEIKTGCYFDLSVFVDD